jgi:hypothetical protein
MDFLRSHQRKHFFFWKGLGNLKNLLLQLKRCLIDPQISKALNPFRHPLSVIDHQRMKIFLTARSLRSLDYRDKDRMTDGGGQMTGPVFPKGNLTSPKS